MITTVFLYIFLFYLRHTSHIRQSPRTYDLSLHGPWSIHFITSKRPHSHDDLIMDTALIHARLVSHPQNQIFKNKRSNSQHRQDTVSYYRGIVYDRSHRRSYAYSKKTHPCLCYSYILRSIHSRFHACQYSSF